MRELLELVGLDPDQYGRRFPHELSGGERQRVGVARALGGDPPVLLMDEPFGAVDPITRQRLQQQFLDLQAALKKTIVFVTHDIEEATKLGDRIAVLSKGGVLEQYDTPSEVLGRPATGIRGRLRRRRPGGPTPGCHAPSNPTISSTPPRSRPINPCSTSGQPSVARTAVGRWWWTTEAHLYGWVDLDPSSDGVGAGPPRPLRCPGPGRHFSAGGVRRDVAARRALDSGRRRRPLPRRAYPEPVARSHAPFGGWARRRGLVRPSGAVLSSQCG